MYIYIFKNIQSQTDLARVLHPLDPPGKIRIQYARQRAPTNKDLGWDSHLTM